MRAAGLYRAVDVDGVRQAVLRGDRAGAHRPAGCCETSSNEGPPEFRQAYARLLLDEVLVTDEETRISGSKSVLARCAAQGVAEPVPKVLSFVQEWRARTDSNL